MSKKKGQKLKVDQQPLNFDIVNNTDAVILMSFLGDRTNLQDISNQYRRFSFDVTGFDWSTYDTVILTYLQDGASAEATVSAPIMDRNLQGVINALNTLSIASFFILISGGSTFIQTYNDTVAIIQFEVTGEPIVGGNVQYDLSQPSGVGPEVGNRTEIQTQDGSIVYISLQAPYNESGSFNVPDGTAMQYSGKNWDTLLSGQATVENVTDSTVIFDSGVMVPGDPPFSFDWAIDPGKTYKCTYVTI